MLSLRHVYFTLFARGITLDVEMDEDRDTVRLVEEVSWKDSVDQVFQCLRVGWNRGSGIDRVVWATWNGPLSRHC